MSIGIIAAADRDQWRRDADIIAATTEAFVELRPCWQCGCEPTSIPRAGGTQEVGCDCHFGAPDETTLCTRVAGTSRRAAAEMWNARAVYMERRSVRPPVPRHCWRCGAMPEVATHRPTASVTCHPCEAQGPTLAHGLAFAVERRNVNEAILTWNALADWEVGR